MKKITCMLLAISIVVCMMPMAFAASDEAVEAANALYELGLFRGTGTNADGTPNFDLDRVPTRFEAITMLVRLLGKEEEAVSRTWETPFTDVADWAAPYVGYAYENGLTTGTSSTTFGGYDAVNATQYITLVLRSLGYTSGTDFQWDKAWELSDKIGMTDGRYNEQTATFTRGDVAIISYSSLTLKENSNEAGKVPNGFTDGYEVAEYQRFNSFASENGLGGTKVYINGKLDGTEMFSSSDGSMIIGTLRDDRDNRWLVELQLSILADETEYANLIGKPIVMCGVYEGYSGVRQLPVIVMSKLCVIETGDIKSGIGKILYPDDSVTNDPANTTGDNETLEPSDTTVTFRNSSDVRKYLESTYSGFSFESSKTDGFDTVTQSDRIKVESVVVTWDSPDKISIWIFCDAYLRYNLSPYPLYPEKAAPCYNAAKQYMRTIADDLMEKLPNTEFTDVRFYYSWYTYPNLKIDFNSVSYCRWHTVNGSFEWWPTSDDTEIQNRI